MVEKKTWEEFRSTGLTLIINQILHIFGWAITYEINDEGEIISCYPARCKFRGFEGDCVSKSYVNVSKWMKDHAEELLDEAEDEA